MTEFLAKTWKKIALYFLNR